MAGTSPLWTGVFWKASAERALRTMSQTLLAFITALPVVLDRPVFHFNWTVALVVTGVSGLVSLLTSICSTAVGTNGPSLTGAEHLDYTKNGST